MAIINYKTHEVQLKIALHGPPSSGRATTLAQLHSLSPDSKDGLAIPEGESGKPVFFSFAAGPSQVFEGFETRFEFYALSGKVSDEKALRVLLRDADGVVLVADSQWERLEDDVKSLQDIEEALKKEGGSLEEVAFALQYNKRDLADVAPGNYMDFLLNNRPNPAQTFETVATNGESIAAMQKALLERVSAKFAESYSKVAA